MRAPMAAPRGPLLGRGVEPTGPPPLATPRQKTVKEPSVDGRLPAVAVVPPTQP